MKDNIVGFFLLCLLLANGVMAQDTPFGTHALREGDLPITPPAVFSSRETIAFLPQTPKVNIITGEYCDEECDLLVAGIEPLSINRFYYHFSGIFQHLHGHWRVNPEAFMLFNFEAVGSPTFTAVGDNNGSFFVYEQPIGNGFQIDGGKIKGYTNIDCLTVGQNHPLNTKVTYGKGHVHRTFRKTLYFPEDHYWWEGKIKDGNGRERIFITDTRQWPQAGKGWPCRRSQHPVSGEITNDPLEFEAPYQALITEERKPNGNVIRYEYNDINTPNRLFDHNLPTAYVLKSIKAYSQKGLFLGSIDVSYAGGADHARKPSIWYDRIVYIGSDGRRATCFNQQRSVNSRNCFDAVLTGVEAAGKPALSYTNRWDKNYYNTPFISQAISGSKSLLETSYDPKTKKVNCQSAPVGQDGQMVPIARYEYHDDHTVVYDGENNKIIYRFNGDKRIRAIEKYQGDRLYSVEKNEWDANTGNLMRKTIEDAQERLIATTDPLGYKTTFAYDTNFNLISQSGPRSDMHKEWVYDTANRPIQEKEWQTDGTILTTEKKYDKTSRVIATRDACGFETHYTHDSLGRVIETHHPDGSCEKKEYDVLGNVVQEVDGNGYVTKKIYNFRSQPIAVYYPDGTEEHFSYNNNSGTLATHVDSTGVKKDYTYDLFDNPIKTETYAADGTLISTVTATYSPFRKLSETDPNGQTTHFNYDFAGRKIAEKKGEKLLTYSYDELGRLSCTKENEIKTCLLFDVKGEILEKQIVGEKLYFQETYTYDEAGNRTSVTTGEGSSKTIYNSRKDPICIIDPLGNTTEIAYSYQSGLIKTTTDPKGIQTLALHDSMKRLIDLQVKNRDGQLIQREEKQYDLAGNQTKAIEHLYEGPTLRETITHQWSYGPKGRIERILEAGQKETHYLYDTYGRLKTLLKPDGEEIHRAYDTLSRLARFYGQGIDYHYIYDLKSRLVKIEDKVRNTSLERAYDIYDHLIKEKLDNGVVIFSDFDPYGKRTSLYLPDGSQTDYSYDGPYLQSVTRNNLIHTYSKRNLAGRPTTIILPDQSTLTLTYDPLLRWKTCQSPHFNAAYDYDMTGNLQHYYFADTLGKETIDYAYDDLNQLISEKEHSYTYDSLYNRRRKDHTPYSINSLCQITHDGKNPYTYDKNGNLLSDGESTYEYDIVDFIMHNREKKKFIINVYIR